MRRARGSRRRCCVRACLPACFTATTPTAAWIARARRFGDELDRIGYRGDEPAGGHKLGAHFEVHIEQGPILEAEGKTIGIVTGVQGMRWFEVTVTGAESHAGSTPMPLRHDAMLAARG